MTFVPPTDDDTLDLGFAGVQPASPGQFIPMPKGEYQFQCTGAKRFYTGENKGTPDKTKPNIQFDLVVVNHPLFEGKEVFPPFSNSLLPPSKPFLLNTLMCLLPEIDWQNDDVPKPGLTQLTQMVKGRSCNGLVDWNIVKSQNTGHDIVVNKMLGLKPYDATVPPPMPSQGNPPDLSNSTSPVAAKAAAGVSQDEVNEFLKQANSSTPPEPVKTGEEAFNLGF